MDPFAVEHVLQLAVETMNTLIHGSDDLKTFREKHGIPEKSEPVECSLCNVQLGLLHLNPTYHFESIKNPDLDAAMRVVMEDAAISTSFTALSMMQKAGLITETIIDLHSKPGRVIVKGKSMFPDASFLMISEEKREALARAYITLLGWTYTTNVWLPYKNNLIDSKVNEMQWDGSLPADLTKVH